MTTHRNRHHGGPHGTGAFTLIELIVALSVSALLIFFVGRLFSDVGDAVALGINKTEMAANSNTISDAIHGDALAMVGAGPSATVPLADGILVILNHEITAPIRSRTSSDGEIVRPVRSDQLLFIRDVAVGTADALEPLVATHQNTYAGSSNPAANLARVWYGHLRRTHEFGGDTYDYDWPPSPDTVGDLGTKGSAGSEINLWANGWILGRQVLFLRAGGVPPPNTHADSALYNAPISGGFVGDQTLKDVFGNSPPPAYYALADVAAMDLSGTGDPNNAIIGTNPATDGGYLIRPFLGPTSYAQRAYHLTFGIERLRVNPAMPRSLERQKPKSSRFESWRAAQIHPHLMANVSDFIVEFAADIVDDPPPLAPLGFPDNFPDNAPDKDNTGNIIWYSHYFGSLPLLNQGALPSYPAYQANPTYTQDPYTGGSQINLPNASGAFVWRHDADASPPQFAWPYLIRIRYRLHDERGILGEAAQTATTAADPGLWFEQIIAVNRN